METEFPITFQKNYERTVNYFGSDNSKNLLMSLACKYTLENKQFSGVALQKVVDEIEKSTNEFLPIRNNGVVNYYIAARILFEQNEEEYFKQLLEKDAVLKQAGFKKTPFRIVGAMFLQKDMLLHANRSKLLFDQMNRKQRFLTSNEDIPHVVLLSEDSAHNPALQVDTIYRYYQDLKRQGFIMGNHLQSLAQIMTMYSEEYNEVLLQYVVQLQKELQKRKIKVRRIHYPYLGILALTATNDTKVDEIVQLYEALLEQKAFRMAKEYALIVAIQKIVKELTELQNIIGVSSITKLEYLFFTADLIVDIITSVPGGIGDIMDFFNN